MDSTLNKVFIKDLPRKTNLSSLKSFIQKYVKVVQFTKQKTHAQNELLAVTVEVADQKQVKKLLSQDYNFEGNKLNIYKFLSAEERLEQSMEIKKKRVFVNDLSVDVTEKEILNFFIRYGEIYAVFFEEKIRGTKFLSRNNLLFYHF